jgi:Holliday junction resolvase
VSGTRSRNKGKAGEREVVLLLKRAGFMDARRGYQYRDGDEMPDVVGVPWWVEVKRHKVVNIKAAMRQAIAASGEQTPVVFSRDDRSDWLVTLRADDFLEIVSEG